MIYLTCYSDLAKLAKFYEDLLSGSSNKIVSKYFYFHKCIVSLGAVNLDIAEIDAYRTNRYFQEAIGIKVLPSTKEIINFSKSKNFQIINSYISKLIGKKFKCNDHKVISNALIKYSLKLNTKYAGEIKNLQSLDSFFKPQDIKFLKKNGYLIKENFLTPADADKYKKQILVMAESELIKDNAYIYGDNKLQRVYNLIGKNKTFHSLLLDERINSLLNIVFSRNTLHDKYLLSSFHANIIKSGGGKQPLHVDAAVPEPLPKWIIRANINFILEDYTTDNGATICLPGSHKFNKKPSREDENNPNLIKLTAPKGSIVIWTGHLWHQSGINASKKPRIGLLACYAASFLKEMVNEEDYAYLLNKESLKKLDPKLKKLIGYQYGVKAGSNLNY